MTVCTNLVLVHTVMVYQHNITVRILHACLNPCLRESDNRRFIDVITTIDTYHKMQIPCPWTPMYTMCIQ